MRLPHILILLIFHTVNINGQSTFDPIGANNIATANTSTTLMGLWSGFHNPAGLSDIKNIEIGLHFQNAYNIEGFNNAAVGLSLPVKAGSAFLGVNRFGDDIYNEHRIGLAYGLKVGIVSFGGRFNYLQYHIIDFGTTQAYAVDFGVIAHLTEVIKLGAYAINLTDYNRQVDEIQVVPTILSLGIEYLPLTFLHFNFELEKSLAQEAFSKFSFQYKLLDRWSLLSGIRTDSWQSFYGLGFHQRRFSVNYALSSHPVLGLSHAMSLGFKSSKK